MATFLLKLKQHWLKFWHYLAQQGVTYWLKWSLITLMCVETIQRTSLIGMIAWLPRKPGVTITNYLIILAIFLFLQAILANRRAATILGMSIMIMFAAADYVKQSILLEHIFPWDFSTIPELLTLLPAFSGNLLLICILVLLVIPLMGYFIYKAFKNRSTKQTPLKRVLMVSCSSIFLANIVALVHIPFVTDYIAGYYHKNDHAANYKRNGLLLSFGLSTQLSFEIEGPKHYSFDAVKQIISDSAPIAQNNRVRPNVIVVMSESLFDPTQLDLNYSKNPLPHLHKLQAQYGSSNLISPTYASGTCNAEFEVLTGFSLNFFPRGSLPYQQHIRRELPALPYIFRQNGYKTVAIHPYRRTFFSRETIYKKFLGFDDYISEEDWHDPQYRGEYIGDHDFVQKIIETTQESDEPHFIFAISMQNHHPFSTPHDPKLSVKDDALSQDSQQTLNGYLAGVQDTDKSLMELIHYFEKSSRPTIVVFFGDHLPSLSDIFNDIQFFEKSNNPFAQYTVPALLWSNYKYIPPVQSMSAFYLGGYILEQAGIKPPLHFAFLSKMRKEYPIVFYDRTQDKHGKIHNTYALKYSDSQLQNMIQEYWVLQHDLMFGEQYLWVR